MQIAKLALVVRDYDEAIEWFTRCLNFELAEDVDMGMGKRWVVVEPPGTRGAALLLAKAANPQQEAAIGNQAGGRVFLFLETTNFDRDHAHMVSEGVRFREAPRTEAYGKVAVFDDLYGNGWDLIGAI
ncbi:MAG TPA: VOC family protein [Hyphomonadaceae bacterium]|nr:VOC family protein [Hyphomonadaceae bacterium]HPN05487.1 VOC family protein [Hyphomonadaceae bacterium]